ncbi:hypothetical protein CLU79DRAFT_747531 [Phycomyces nitens]|nr:hypothetical protein CLU79DRAFT_747531 [Phycomyces nitens]
MSFSKSFIEKFSSTATQDIAGWSSMTGFFASPANPSFGASAEPDNGSGLLSPFDMHLSPPTDLILHGNGALVASQESGYFLSEMPMLSPSFLNQSHDLLQFPTSNRIPLLYSGAISSEYGQEKHILQSQAYPSPLELPSSTLTSADLRIDGLFSSNAELFPSSLLDDDHEGFGGHNQTHQTAQAPASVWSDDEVVDRTPELDASWPFIRQHFSGSTSTLCNNNSVVFYTMPNSPESTTLYSPVSTNTVSPEYYYDTEQPEIDLSAMSDHISEEFNDQLSPTSVLLLDLENAIVSAQQGIECGFESLQLRAYSLIQQPCSSNNGCGAQERQTIHDTLSTLLHIISSHDNELIDPQHYQCDDQRSSPPQSPSSTLSDCIATPSFPTLGSPNSACQESTIEKRSSDMELADSETDDDGDFCLSTVSSDDEYEESSGRPIRKIFRRTDRRTNTTGYLRKRSRNLSLVSEPKCGSLRPQTEIRSRISQTSRKTRKNYSRDTTRVLMDWYLLHDGETPDANNKERLANLTNKTPAQISTWFQNARRRHNDKLQQFKSLASSHPSLVYDYASFIAYDT